MCIATAATVAGLAGSAISGIGAIGAGQAQAASANYQAQIAANNATIAQQNANYATAAGETKAYNQALQERAKAGAITGGIAAGGIDVNTGSAADVRESQEALGLQDVEQQRQTAALQAYGFRTQATNYTAQSQLETAQAGFDTEAGWFTGLGSLLSGAAKFGPGVNSLFGTTSSPYSSATGTGALY